jgi:signal peptidase I
MKFPDSWYERQIIPSMFPPMLKDRVVILLIALMMSVVGIGIIVVAYASTKYDCNYASRQYNRPTKYNFISGCYIKSGDRYIALDKYIAITEDK